MVFCVLDIASGSKYQKPVPDEGPENDPEKPESYYRIQGDEYLKVYIISRLCIILYRVARSP